MCTTAVSQSSPAQGRLLAAMLHHFWLNKMTTGSQDPQSQTGIDFDKNIFYELSSD